MRLLEFLNEIESLLESRLEFVRQQAKKLGNVYLWSMSNSPDIISADFHATMLRDHPKLNDPETDVTVWGNALIDEFVKLDPSEDHRYVQWIAQIFKRGTFKLEDAYKVPEYITKFEQVKRQLPADQRDIRKFASLSDLFMAIKDIEVEDSANQLDKKLDREMHQQADVLYNGTDYKVLIPKTCDAAKYFGRNTQWCTAASHSTNYYDMYNKRGPLYIVLHKPTNRRWQFHFETKQFMDENDHQIDLDEFAVEHPKVDRLFGKRFEKDIVGHVGDLIVLETDETLAAVPSLGLKMDYHFLLEKSKFGMDYDAIATKADKDSIIRILNMARNLEGKNHQNLIRHNIFYKDGRFGEFNELADDYLRIGNATWKAFTVSESEEYYELTTNPDLFGDTTGLVDVENIHGSFSAESDGEAPSDEYHPHIVALLKKIKVKEIDDRSDFQIRDMSSDLIKELIGEKPELATPDIIYKVYGNSDITKTSVFDYLANEDVAVDEWVGDYLVVHEHRDVHDLIEDHGNDTMKFVAELSNGERDFDIYHNEVDTSYHRDDLLDSLRDDRKDKLIAYLRKEYSSEIEEEEIDLSSTRGIIELLDYVDDDEIERAFRSAVVTGEETGARDEAIQSMNNQVDSHPYIFMLKDGKLHKKFTYDETMVIAIPLDEAVAACDENNAYTINGDGWLSYLDAPLELDEPHYGWNGFDKEAAASVFSEDIAEIVD